MLLVALFGLGHAAAIVVAGTSVHGVQRWLAWRGGARAATVLRGVAGVAVIAGGLYFIHTVT